MAHFFDTHCHLAGEELIPKADDLTQRAYEADVLGLCLISADKESLEKAPALAKDLSLKHPEMKIAYSAGIHPHDAKTVDDELWQNVLTASEDAVAIGETGLDFHYNLSDKEVQIEIFDRHIELAKKTQKPLVLHCRNAADDLLDRLKSLKIQDSSCPGILHCFTEDLPVAKVLLDLGFVISFSGILSFKNASDIRDVAKYVPIDRILIETDSPWLAPVPNRGKKNEPAFVSHVFDCMADLKSEHSKEKLKEQFWENSLKIYSL